MRPTQHPSNNRVLGAPAGWDQSGLPVKSLGITDQVMEGIPCVWSFWQVDAEELAALNAGGLVILSIVGRTMPPACLMVTGDDSALRTPPYSMKDAFEDKYRASWEDPSNEHDRRVWTDAWEAARL